MSDRIVFFAYMVVVLGVGYWAAIKTRSLDDYLLGGRRVGPLATALTMQSTAMSGYLFMGGPAYAYQQGYFALWYSVGDAGGGIFNLAVLGRRMRKLSALLGALTPVEYLEKRYELPTIRIVGAIIALIFTSAYVFAQFIAGGKAISMVLGVPYVWGLLGGMGVVIIYTLMGGYRAVVWTDCLQGMIMVICAFSLLVTGIVKAGGMSNLHSQIAQADPSLLSIWGKDYAYIGQWGMILGAFLIYLIGYPGIPHIVVRNMSIRSPKAVRPALVYTTIWAQFFTYAPYICGIIGIALLPNLSDPEMVIPELAYLLLPRALAGLMITAILAAVMSTADSQLIQVASILSRDVYERFINPQATDRQMVTASRMLVLIIGLVGFAVAYFQPPAIFSLVVFAWGVLSNSFLIPMLCSVYWPKANGAGALASMIGGGITNILWTVLAVEKYTGFHPFFAGLLVSIACMAIFTKLGHDNSEEILNAVRKVLRSASLQKPVQACTPNAGSLFSPEFSIVGRFLDRAKPNSQVGDSIA